MPIDAPRAVQIETLSSTTPSIAPAPEPIIRQNGSRRFILSLPLEVTIMTLKCNLGNCRILHIGDSTIIRGRQFPFTAFDICSPVGRSKVSISSAVELRLVICRGNRGGLPQLLELNGVVPSPKTPGLTLLHKSAKPRPQCRQASLLVLKFEPRAIGLPPKVAGVM
jgi:hypothetical protein